MVASVRIRKDMTARSTRKISRTVQQVVKGRGNEDGMERRAKTVGEQG